MPPKHLIMSLKQVKLQFKDLEAKMKFWNKVSIFRSTSFIQINRNNSRLKLHCSHNRMNSQLVKQNFLEFKGKTENLQQKQVKFISLLLLECYPQAKLPQQTIMTPSLNKSYLLQIEVKPKLLLLNSLTINSILVLYRVIKEFLTILTKKHMQRVSPLIK